MNQYREGKVKRTPARGVKQYLKPHAYKQWEGYGEKLSAFSRQLSASMCQAEGGMLSADSFSQCLTSCLLNNELASYCWWQG